MCVYVCVGNRYDPEPRTRRVYKDDYSNSPKDTRRTYHDEDSTEDSSREYKDKGSRHPYSDEPEEEEGDTQQG